MNFEFNKAQCLNLRKSLLFEWLETNGLGDYASGTIVGCNTRKYHGLYVGNLDKPAGRHVLLSTLEEEVVMLTTSAPRYLPASSKDVRVRVLGS